MKKTGSQLMAKLRVWHERLHESLENTTCFTKYTYSYTLRNINETGFFVFWHALYTCLEKNLPKHWTRVHRKLLPYKFIADDTYCQAFFDSAEKEAIKITKMWLETHKNEIFGNLKHREPTGGNLKYS